MHHKGPYIKDVRKIFGIFDPLPPLVRIFARSIRVNPRNLPYYVCFWATPLPPSWCGRPLCMAPYNTCSSLAPFTAMSLLGEIEVMRAQERCLPLTSCQSVYIPQDIISMSRQVSSDFMHSVSPQVTYMFPYARWRSRRRPPLIIESSLFRAVRISE